MSDRSWNRREFGRAVIPALAVVSALTAARANGRGTDAAGARDEWPDLWPQARATARFHEDHLPAGHRLGRPVLAATRDGAIARRSARLVVLDGDSAVGYLHLDATFPGDDPASCLWQGTVVAGAWYAPTVTNACRAGRFA